MFSKCTWSEIQPTTSQDYSLHFPQDVWKRLLKWIKVLTREALWQEIFHGSHIRCAPHTSEQRKHQPIRDNPLVIIQYVLVFPSGPNILCVFKARQNQQVKTHIKRVTFLEDLPCGIRKWLQTPEILGSLLARRWKITASLRKSLTNHSELDLGRNSSRPITPENHNNGRCFGS